jgi:hypothetical protein
MKPATPLVLTAKEHAMIGELVEIMGQVDHTMIQTVGRLLNVDQAAAGKIMGSTKVSDNSKIWALVIRNRISDAAIDELVTIAQKELSATADLRNDFIHALFTGDYVEAGALEPGTQTTSATRIKSGAKRSTKEIETARNRAATLPSISHRRSYEGRRGSRPVTMARKTRSITSCLSEHSSITASGNRASAPAEAISAVTSISASSASACRPLVCDSHIPLPSI